MRLAISVLPRIPEKVTTGLAGAPGPRQLPEDEIAQFALAEALAGCKGTAKLTSWRTSTAAVRRDVVDDVGVKAAVFKLCTRGIGYTPRKR
jgi:hypothetical protein